MRMFKPVLGVLIFSGAVGVGVETAIAQGFGFPTPGPAPAPSGVPITVTGRIVKENGDPLPGVQMAGMLQTESMMGGMGPALPVSKPFSGIPKACFGDGATATTDADGRYNYRTTFLPDATINMRGDKCSTLRDRLTAANATVVPWMSQPLMQQYNFERATGPLPAKLPMVNPGVKAPPKTPPGGTPLQMNR